MKTDLSHKQVRLVERYDLEDDRPPSAFCCRKLLRRRAIARNRNFFRRAATTSPLPPARSIPVAAATSPNSLAVSSLIANN